MTSHRHPTLASGEDIETHFLDALRLLRSVRRTLSELLDRVEGGENGLLKEVGLKHSELESALRRAFEAEEKYNAWHEKTSGLTQAPACEIDFDALRAEIACRLQTIRECCQEGG